MRRLLVLLGLLSLVSAPLGGLRADVASGRVSGSFIVELRGGVDPARASEAIARRYGGRAVYVYDAVLHGFAFAGPDSARSELLRDPRVARVSDDYTVRASDVVDKADYLQVDRALDARNHAPPYTGSGVVIGVLDTGVFAQHSVFQPDTIAGQDGHCVGQKNAPDANGHGTATASQAAGEIGVARDAKIFAVKVFPGASSTTTWSAVICGMNFVRKKHPEIRVVNLSLAGPGNPALRVATENLIGAGVVVVAAGGDNGGALEAPALYPGVISVSALTRSGNAFASAFSAHNGDLAAPGVQTFSASNAGPNAFTHRTGTSRSAPQVAGAAAVVLALAPTDTPAMVLEDLRTTGRCPDGSLRGSSPCSTSWPQSKDREPRIDVFCAAAAADPSEQDC